MLVAVLDRNPLQTRARSRALEGRRTPDLAEGILIGLRRFSIEHAFDELMVVASRHGVSIAAAAAALVELASDGLDSAGTHAHASAVARLEWGDLLTHDTGPSASRRDVYPVALARDEKA